MLSTMSRPGELCESDLDARVVFLIEIPEEVCEPGAHRRARVAHPLELPRELVPVDGAIDEALMDIEVGRPVGDPGKQQDQPDAVVTTYDVPEGRVGEERHRRSRRRVDGPEIAKRIGDVLARPVGTAKLAPVDLVRPS